MKIAIYNLGPIRRYQFDTTKDFQIVVGKSYAMTLVYIVLKALLGIPESLRTPSPLAAVLDDVALEKELKSLIPYKEYEQRDVRETMADLFR